MPQLCTRSTPALSIIVPWMGNDRLFEDTLAAVLRNRPIHSEIIVPHDDRFMDRYGLSEEVEFCQLPPLNPVQPGTTLRALVDLGLRFSQGNIINLIRPGIEVDEGWSARPLEILNGNSQIASVSTPILNAHHPKRLLTCGISHSIRMKRKLIAGRTKSSWQQLNRRVIGPSSWCAFYSRNALNLICSDTLGPAEFHDVSWDLDIALALNAVGYKHQVAADYSVSSEHDLESEEGGVSGTDASRMAVRYAGCQTQLKLAARCVATLAEYTVGLISPTRAKFTLGRFLAGKYRESDRQYARFLESRRQTMIQQGALPNQPTINRAA